MPVGGGNESQSDPVVDQPRHAAGLAAAARQLAASALAGCMPSPMPSPTYLAIDIGTGTQDIYLLRAGLSPENGFKLVLPSATMIIRRRIQQATQRGEAILLDGVTMGGGPCAWAAEDHVRAGRKLFATPAAARTFNDDLEAVQRELGVQVVSEDEAARLHGVDAHPAAGRRSPRRCASPAPPSASTFGPAAVGVAVFDHGAAPAGVSDRQYRFDYLAQRIRQHNRLTAFAYPAEEIPGDMTRLQRRGAIRRRLRCPLLAMDTAPAAVLGAQFDSGLDPPFAGTGGERRQLPCPRLPAWPRRDRGRFRASHRAARPPAPGSPPALLRRRQPDCTRSLCRPRARGARARPAAPGPRGRGTHPWSSPVPAAACSTVPPFSPIWRSPSET